MSSTSSALSSASDVFRFDLIRCFAKRAKALLLFSKALSFGVVRTAMN